MGCRCKERKEFLKKQFAEFRAAQAAGHPPQLGRFLRETAVKMPLGKRNLPATTLPGSHLVEQNGWLVARTPQ